MTYVDGLASGINASQMITSLMAAERVPQQQLNSQRTTLNRQQSAFNDVKDLYKAALAKVQNLADTATWNAKKATSSNDSVAATVTSDALTTQITFNVTQTAAAHSMYTNDVVQADDIVATSGRFAGMTATEAIDDINNDETLNTTAALIQTAPGDYRIQLTAHDTGATSNIGVTAADFDLLTGGLATLTQGRNAQISIPGDTPLVIESTTNTFEDLVPGLDITVTQTTSDPTTITIDDDVDALADNVEAMFTELGAAMSRVDSLTDTDATTRSLLSSSGVLRRSENSLTRAVIDPVDNSTLVTGSFAGITLGQDGTITFDRAAFIDAHEKDPEAVTNLFHSDTAGTETILSRLENELEAATNFTDGYLSTSEDAVEQRIRQIDDQIAAWDIRLEKRELNYRQMFTQLETALSNLQQQASWLSGQIANLPSAESMRGG
ncbi:MAG: hypothetical protein EBZ15_04310 [Actinobacteria bacterium]|nr:hypothetical protein [Actinomycetota bacterium]